MAHIWCTYGALTVYKALCWVPNKYLALSVLQSRNPLHVTGEDSRGRESDLAKVTQEVMGLETLLGRGSTTVSPDPSAMLPPRTLLPPCNPCADSQKSRDGVLQCLHGQNQTSSLEQCLTQKLKGRDLRDQRSWEVQTSDFGENEILAGGVTSAIVARTSSPSAELFPPHYVVGISMVSFGFHNIGKWDTFFIGYFQFNRELRLTTDQQTMSAAQCAMKVKLYLQTEHIPAARGAESGSTEGASWGRAMMTWTERKGEAIRCVQVLGQMTLSQVYLWHSEETVLVEWKVGQVEEKGKRWLDKAVLTARWRKRDCAIGTRKAGHESVTKAYLAVIPATVGKRDETGIKWRLLFGSQKSIISYFINKI